MDPTSLIMVECASKAWFRFVLAGRVTSGTLKTPAQADSESLQVILIHHKVVLDYLATCKR